MPMPPAKFKDSIYNTLLAQIRKEMVSGVKEIERLIEQQTERFLRVWAH